MKKMSILMCLMVALALSWPSMYAQLRTGSILGTVTDSTGAILPGVEVTAISVDTGQSRLAITGDEGTYRISLLDPGSYEVRAELAGFQTAVRRGLNVSVGQEILINLTLEVGAISEEVVVTGEAPLVNTTSSTLSDVISEKQVHELPLNNRNLIELSLLSPGVVQARASSYTGETTSPAAVKISMGGARIYMTGYILDGTDITDSSRSSGVGGSAGSLFGVETVKEFNVITNNYSAQYGRFAGGVISLVTKSGTNEFHGSAFWFHRNDNFDARNFFDRDSLNPLERSSPPEFRRHQYGGTIGGPIVPNKSFFFFSYEGYRQNLDQSLVAFVPTASARNGDIDGDGINEIPVNPDSIAFLNLYPLPNGADLGGGRAEYFNVGSEPVNEDFITARIDHNFSDSDSFFGRYTMSDGDRGLPSALAGDGWLSDSFATYVTLEEKHIFSPNLVNTFRVGYQRTTWSQSPPMDDVCGGDCTGSPLDISAESGGGFGQIIVGGGTSSFGIFLQGKNVTNMYSYADDLFLNRGNHSLKIGVSFTRYQNNDFFDGWRDGRYTFGSLAGLLTGVPREWRGKAPGASSLRGSREWVYGFYIQDDYKATPNLTLNLGLRYEVIQTPTEVNGIQYRLGNDPLNTTQPSNEEPFFENPSLTNFAPRIGIAWDPFGDGTTSIRAGYGIFHDTILFYQFANSMRRNCPINSTLVQRSGITFPRPTTPPTNLDECPFGRVGFQAFEFEIPQPYMQQWNVSIQRELFAGTSLTTAYVGSKGTHLLGHRDINTAEPIGFFNGAKDFGAPGTPKGPPRNPAFSNITYWDYGYDSGYHGLTASLRKRFSQGLQFQASYTWGKSLDTNSRANSGDSSGPASEPQDTYDLRQNKGASDHHVEHAFRFNWAYALPVSGMSGAAKVLLEGWQMQGIVSLNTGGPLQINLGSGANLTDYNRDRARGQERASLRPGADPNAVRADGRDPNQYFDPTNYIIHPAGTYGTGARNPLIGPGVATTDLSFHKNTALGETVNMEFRIEMFNIFNRANFGSNRMGLNVFSGVSSTLDANRLPTSVTYNSSAGRINKTGTTSRQLQLALRFVF